MAKKQVFMVESGNELAALAASQINYHVMGYFPITPSTQIAEYLDELKAKGENTVNMVPGDGEHGAAGISYGAATAGGRVLNATSANGLLYAMEQLPVQSGTRFPMVLNVINRSVSGPLDIKCDHSDIMMALNTGWLILMAKDPQEVYDMNICAPKIGEDEEVRLPVIVSSDGFFTSHQKRRVEIFEDRKDVQNFIGPYKEVFSTVNSKEPITVGCYMNDPDLGNNHVQLAEAVKGAKKVIKKVFKEFKDFAGREYDVVGEYQTSDADVILMAVGSSVNTIITAVDNLRAKGQKVGVVWPRIIRPFPTEELNAAVKNAKLVVALDRQDTYSGLGGNLSIELRAGLHLEGINTPVLTQVYGLGGKELSIEEAEGIFAKGFDTIDEKAKEIMMYLESHFRPGQKGGCIPKGLAPLETDDVENAIEIQMGDNNKLEVKKVNLRNLTGQAKRFTPGHGACTGCGIFSGLNTFMRGITGHVVVLFQTGCAMVVSTGYPYSNHRVTYIHNLFQNGAATISGVSEMFKERQRRGEIPMDEEITFIMVTGDGGADIGMGPIVGTANRNNNVIILEYDNEGYMNTGNQLSYSTPLGHATSTSHVGPAQVGKQFQHKDTVQIMAGTHIPYLFTGTEAQPQDLIKKAAKAQWYAKNYGTVYGKILAACPLNWKSDARQGRNVVEAAVLCNFFPLYEIEQGITSLTYDPEEKGKKVELEDWLKMMGKTKHLLKPENKEIVESARKEIERRFKRIKAMSEHPDL